MKKFALLLTVLISVAAFPAEPVKVPATSAAPVLADKQVIGLLKFENQFMKLQSQMTSLQTQMQGLQKGFQDFSADLCKSSDGKKYTIDLSSDDPKCVVVQPPVTAKK